MKLGGSPRGFLAILERLGLPTTNKRGHEIGCLCADCRRDRADRDGRPPDPGTLGAVLADGIRRYQDERRRRSH